MTICLRNIYYHVYQKRSKNQSHNYLWTKLRKIFCIIVCLELGVLANSGNKIVCLRSELNRNALWKILLIIVTSYNENVGSYNRLTEVEAFFYFCVLASCFLGLVTHCPESWCLKVITMHATNTIVHFLACIKVNSNSLVIMITLHHTFLIMQYIVLRKQPHASQS